MVATLLLLAVFLGQGIPVRQDQSGTITGVLRDTAGKPLASVRVAAVAQDPEAIAAGQAEAMSALAETDANGRYVLENVPPGRYLIAAGRLGGQTYYPGIADGKNGKTVLVTPGLRVAGIDFTLLNESQGRASPGNLLILLSGPPTLRIPIDVRSEGGGRIPIFSPRGMPALKFTAAAAGSDVSLPLDSFALTLYSAPPDYRVSVQGLPDGVSVKSMTYGSTNLLSAPLVVSSPVFNALASPSIPPELARLQSLVAVSMPTSGPGVTSPLSIVLSANVPPANGVRVAGRVTTGARSIYLSGVAGTLYSDGTFEFRGVRPGRYSIVTLDNPSARPVVASVVVGDRDLDGIEPLQSPVLPIGGLGVRPSSGNAGPSSVVPLATLRGVISDKDKVETLHGRVFISGGFYGTSVDIGENGGFEFSNLLPGDYNIEVQLFRRDTLKQRVTVGDDGARIELVSVPSEADATR